MREHWGENLIVPVVVVLGAEDEHEVTPVALPVAAVVGIDM